MTVGSQREEIKVDGTICVQKAGLSKLRRGLLACGGHLTATTAASLGDGRRGALAVAPRRRVTPNWPLRLTPTRSDSVPVGLTAAASPAGGEAMKRSWCRRRCSPEAALACGTRPVDQEAGPPANR